jgi:Domain of unknown function (DUF4105)
MEADRSTRSLVVVARVGCACGATGLLIVVFLSGCQPLITNPLRDRVIASNARDWAPQFAKLPWAEARPDGTIRISNVRNNLYLGEEDFVPQYYDLDFRLEDIRSVDYLVVPFNSTPLIAHTMVSFGLADGRYFCFSAEIRTERGEKYSPVLGFVRQYEITYVIADERDLVRLRTKYRDSDVYLYRTVATAEQSQAMLVDMLERTNKLASRPEFYNTVVNNCTTNVLNHVNRLRQQKLAFSWKVLFPGYSDQFAWEQGLLDRSVPFEQLKTESKINDLASQYFDDPDFSQRIRQRVRDVKPMEASPATAESLASRIRSFFSEWPASQRRR